MVIRFAAILGLFAVFGNQISRGGDEDHWSFQPIIRPEVPAATATHPIDAFVRNRLTREDLSPSPEAEPSVLLRRLHLDLTGLLPPPAEIESFLDHWSKDADAAFEAKLEALLASPHFGEKWARPWLDLARYADSDGYLGDTLRPWAWVYRDWVVNSINQDQPMDQFSIEQLAGDLLPEASTTQKIATGFHRNNLKNTEAGADRELNRTKQVVDRVATTGTAWLGLTLACAECHDHKHDPISQKEFYQLYAFFNNTEDRDFSVRLDWQWNRYRNQLQKWEQQLEKLETQLNQYSPAQPDDPKKADSIWTALKPDKWQAAKTEFKVQPDHSLVAEGSPPSTVTYFVESPVTRDQTVTGFKLEIFGHFGTGRDTGKTVGRSEDGGVLLSMFFPDLIINGKARRLKLAAVTASHNDPGKGGDLSQTIEPNGEGWRLSTKLYQNHEICFELANPEQLPAGSRLKFSLGHKMGTGQSIRHFRLSTTESKQPLPARKSNSDTEYSRLRLPIEKHLQARPAPPSTKAQGLAELAKNERRESYIHVRGDYNRKGDAVSPATPAILHPFPNREEATRLDLAHWLFTTENPLTARVLANQIWQQLFGVGIVATSDDLGTYGDRPTHPQLLDWLACELRDNGWSRKALIRTILTSSTYRQSSVNTHPQLSNQLLWRQNTYRLPAESIRDIHLAASDLISTKMGGPSIHPPLPEFVTAVGRSVKWPESTGEDRYRRGLYIFLKRTVLYPMLTTFDAPDTSAACSRRERTNTPMQALTLLNDPVFFECADSLGRKVFATHNSDEPIDIALENIYFKTLNRSPMPEEMALLRVAYADFLKELKQPEAAMIATARVVMNLDEFITRN